jgi:hypothetical protein
VLLALLLLQLQSPLRILLRPLFAPTPTVPVPAFGGRGLRYSGTRTVTAPASSPPVALSSPESGTPDELSILRRRPMNAAPVLVARRGSMPAATAGPSAGPGDRTGDASRDDAADEERALLARRILPRRDERVLSGVEVCRREGRSGNG